MPPQAAAKDGSHHFSLCLPIVAILSTVMLGGCDGGAPATEATVRPVRTQRVEIADWKNPATAIGEIKPKDEANIGFRIAGKIAARLVGVGSVLQKGAVIARLDNTNEQNAVSIADTDVKAAAAELADASGQEKRQGELNQRGFTTQVSYDAAARRLKLANAKLESAEIARKDALERLGYAELRSDEAGIVTAVGAEPGQVVGAGQMVVRIARTDTKEAEFKVPERVLRNTPADTQVSISLLGDPSISTTGHVREIATTADPLTRTYAVRVTLDGPPEAMRFGASVQGRIVSEEKNVVLLPSSALFKSETRPAVWVVNTADFTVELRPVTVLRYEVDQVLISEGLRQGERVVTAGVQKLWPGMKVRLL
jgi:RND family efflux transporter MFP subunit